MKNAGKACNNRLYRHIRTFEKIVKNYFVISEKNVQTGVQSCIITLVSEVNENRYQSYGCVLTGQPFQISKGGHSKYVEGGTFQ